MSEKFVDLGVSFFDEDFTLDPFPYIEELYAREDVLGFRSEQMNFVFRFDQARQVMLNRACEREPVANPEIEAREAIYAERYPNRAKNFALVYSMGDLDLVLKKLLLDFFDETAVTADFSDVQEIFALLAQGGRIDDYVETVRTLPLRVMLESCGLPFDEAQLLALNQAGFDFLKALDNFFDESPLPEAEKAVGYCWDYLAEAMPRVPTDAPLAQLVRDAHAKGIDDETLRVNIAAFVIISLSNTAGISSTYLLRNLLRFPEARRQLADDPGLIQNDNVITELLRRDNHVKALSRQVHEAFELDGFAMERGESINLFFPGVNLDPAHWSDPLGLDFERRFTGINNVVFGGSVHMCIGKKLGLAFLKHMTEGFVRHLPEGSHVIEEEVEADGDWVAERIITRMPIQLGD